VTIQTVEFLDPDGSYALVQPFDEVRGRVLSSNVLEKGSVLHKDAELAWDDAAEDLGGFTRLGPSDFLRDEGAAPEPAWENADLVRLLEERDHAATPSRTQDPFLGLESKPATPAEDSEPVGLLRRLVRHLRKQHLKREAGSRWVAPCRCPGFQVKGGRLRSRLLELLTEAFEKEKLPRLSRILAAVRASLGGRRDAA